MEKTTNSYHLISLGCAKNTVDSDSMAQLLEADGYQVSPNAENADVLIVNTCGFIESAREESYGVLRTLAENKKAGQILIAAGCLTQRYGTEVAEHVKGIDGIMGTSAYLKIADGCRRPCTFCAIPLIKGTTVSRPLNSILNEAKELRDSGLRELILISQDTTDYGHDLGMKDGLAVLLERLTNENPAIDWIRIMYAYPGYVTDRLIDVMSSNRQILS